jgi:hypothetical protein
VRPTGGGGEVMSRGGLARGLRATPSCRTCVARAESLEDGIDYHQRFGHLGELIQETLQKLEKRGGPDAFINIR